MVSGARLEMIWKYALTCVLLVNTVTAAPPTNFKALQQCVSGVLAAGGDVAKRLQTPANDTWEDARVGAIMSAGFLDCELRGS